MSERRVERGQWMDREEWRLGMGRCQWRKDTDTYIHIHTYTHIWSS
jgi:hypothetical protein